MLLPLFYDKTLFDEFHVAVPVNWNYTSNAHMLYVGATGTGKSYACLLTLARISLHIPNAQAVICNFKGGKEMDFLKGCSSYYTYLDCRTGLNQFYNLLLARQQSLDQSISIRLLYFDEWAAFIGSLDKKAAEDAKSKMASILMMGRALGLRVLLAVQRADAKLFDNARDNFSFVLTLGNISKESALMLGFDRENMQDCSSIGCGHLLVDGQNLQAVQIPTIRNMDKLQAAIRQIVE